MYLKKFVPIIILLLLLIYGIYTSLQKKIEKLEKPIFKKTSTQVPYYKK